MNMMRNNNSPYSFRGYRSHPIYLERVNNFMLNVKGDDVDVNDDELEAEIVDELHEQTAQFQAQYQPPQMSQEQIALQSQHNALAQQILQKQQKHFNSLNALSGQSNQQNASQFNNQQMNQQMNRQQTQHQTQHQMTQIQPEPTQAPAKVKSSDLRAKRSRLAAREVPSAPAQSSQPTFINGQRRTASYSVKMALGGGSYQADTM